MNSKILRSAKSSPLSPSKFNRSPSSKALVTPDHSTVVVEGNIGSGKAQFLNYLRNEPSVEVFEEPIDLWRNKDGKNLLDLMYKDPKAHSYEFQQYVLKTMADLHGRGLDKSVTLLERSFYSARYVFVENLRRNGLLSAEEYESLDRQFQSYRDKPQNSTVDMIVYLRAAPETVHRRILHRGREEEKSISVEYLSQLHSLYEDWLIHDKFPVPAPVLIIDGEVPLQDVFGQIEKRKDEILCKGINQVTHKSFVRPVPQVAL